MTLLRLMLTTLVLLAQAWPLQAVEAMGQDSACESGCCAWLNEGAMSACACTEESKPAAPVSIPPSGSRELVPLVTWVAADEQTLPAPPTRDSHASAWQKHADQARGQPCVRLAVLFCSLLN